ncbi:MAG: hypothetical protein R3C44_00595 [Chloroflexota bacterium]
MAQEPTVYFAVFHSPGEAWIEDVDFREQPGVMEHVTHYARYLEEGKLLMGGPFLMPNSGGMMIAKSEVTEEELRAYAAADPAVQSKLLSFEIRPWYVPMRSA